MATFELVAINNNTVRTLGVRISDPIECLHVNNFNVQLTAPKGKFEAYANSIIKPIDVLHTREGFGSIVNKLKGNIFVGGLYVCNIPKIKYAYDLYPNRISLDRDRKVPKDFDVMFTISKIQETFENFDRTGKIADTVYSNIPDNHIPNYRPKLREGKITFVTDIVNEEGKVEVHEVSNRYKEQLMGESFFSKVVFKLKKFITSSIGLDELAITFRNKYCIGNDANRDFTILMLKLGIDLPEQDTLPF